MACQVLHPSASLLAKFPMGLPLQQEPEKPGVEVQPASADLREDQDTNLWDGSQGCGCFCKGPERKYFRVMSPAEAVKTTQQCVCSRAAAICSMR
jgi:hypothetical protein